MNLCEAYAGKVVLIVNTASKCAFMSQYEGLEALYETYKERGLVVLGFPSNDFANQEPGTEAEIKTFCRMTYGVQFPMFAKTRVRKNQADPLHQKLGEATGSWPKWNFHKYLLDREGRVVGELWQFYRATKQDTGEADRVTVVASCIALQLPARMCWR